MTIHISFDLETWGTEPGCDIRSIGACVFDPVAGTVGAAKRYETNTQEAPRWGDDLWQMIRNGRNPYLFYIACDNPIKAHVFDGPDVLHYPLHRDPSTIQWWSEQSDEAQGAFTDPVDLRDALMRFADWLNSFGDNSETAFPLVPDIRLWSHGANFDGPVLAAAYRAVGLPVPWHYRAPRDTRTIFDVAGIDDHSAWLNQHPGPLGVPHHALDDAICQARAVCAAYSRIHTVTAAEVQSGLNRVRHAEGLIRQLPEDHDGRNTWLLNYGERP